ncbi:MAG TPA: proton-conducting transporter membrane subunit, partial [Neisseria sp.]|nr:proton-conducting transporter membrane subunit [Neisseria sp.]
YAAFKFFLYTFLGSVLMLVAMIAMYRMAGTTDIVALLDPALSADLLDGMLPPEAKAAPAAAKAQPFNWTLASLVALTVLIMQLFYLLLLR